MFATGEDKTRTRGPWTPHFGPGPWTTFMDWVHGPPNMDRCHSVLGIPIPKSLAFWASPVGDAQNADPFDFA